jgi:3-oxoacyl-[acyl-carrier protein] reductase
MDLGLGGKIAWVLGASSGLGRASAEALAREGAVVALSARRRPVLDEVCATITDAGGQALAVPVDVTDESSIRAGHHTVASELGVVDVLVSNGGGPPSGNFRTSEDPALDRSFQLITASAWHLAKAVAPGMETKGGGCMLFITSSSTKELIPGLLLSTMMRTAVAGLAKTISRELGPKGVRALCVAPGKIGTELLNDRDRSEAESSGRSIEEVRADNESAIPLGRYGKPEEFGDVIAWLSSPRASYVSGVTLLVDGGASVGVLS